MVVVLVEPVVEQNHVVVVHGPVLGGLLHLLEICFIFPITVAVEPSWAFISAFILNVVTVERDVIAESCVG